MLTQTHKQAGSDSSGAFSVDSLQLFRSIQSTSAHDDGVGIQGKKGPTMAQEVGFVNGLNPNGTINNNSYWGDNGQTAFKWGASTAGTPGGTIYYKFDTGSHWTANEQLTFVKAMTLWSSVANIQFAPADSQHATNVLFRRGTDGGAYTSTPTSDGQGATLGHVTGQALISIDTSVFGFDMSGSFDTAGGYGQSTIIHELGHLLGLGHGGDYNGNVDPSTQQFSAWDERQYTIMSYIWWGDTTAKYFDKYHDQGTNWGTTTDHISRQASHTMMGLDVLEIQQLYGASTTSPFTGGQTYGFNSNVSGVLHDFYDFTVNTHPVIMLYNQGIGNTLDLSGYTLASTASLASGTFSSMNGMINNLFIDYTTQINHAVTGSGNDTLLANGFGDVLESGGGNDFLASGAGIDTMTGGAGKDTFYFAGASGADIITDFAEGTDKIQIFANKVTSFGKLTIVSDGDGGALVSWKGGSSVDVQGVAPGDLKSGDFLFGAHALPVVDGSTPPPAFSSTPSSAFASQHAAALGGYVDLSALHHAPLDAHMLAVA